MLDRLYEWYQIAHAAPSDETITKRQASVTNLVETLTSEDSYDLLTACTAAAVTGFESGFAQDSPLVQAAVKAIREHQPAFPQDLSENALELRALCSVTLGEIISKRDDDDALPCASLLVAALPMQPEANGRHLQRVLDELYAAACTRLENTARTRRRRRGGSVDKLANIDVPADVAAFWGQLQPLLKSCLDELQDDAAADREELEILWWLYAGYSRTAKKPIRDLKPGEAALRCGTELANLVMIPATDSARQMVRRAVEEGRGEAGQSEIPVEGIIQQWTAKMLELLAPNEGSEAWLPDQYPALLPLSWLCRRLRESRNKSACATEFESRTGVSAKHSSSAGDWGVQVFNERVAQRFYKDLLEE